MSELNETDDHSVLKLNLKGHKKPVTGLTFEPTGKNFASCGEENSFMVWNLLQNVRSYCFKGHSDIVTDVEYSPDGKLLASCSQDQTVRIWVPTIKGNSVEFRAHPSAVRTLSFSPDNTKIITGSNDKSIKMWRVARKQFISSFVGHTNWIRSAKFSPNGDIIASGSDDQTLRIWDAKSGQNIHTFRGSKSGSPTALSFNNRGSAIAVAMSSGSVRVYDLGMRQLQQHYVLHDSTTSVSWHPNANFLLTSGKDGKVVVVDLTEGRPLYTIKGHEGAVLCLKFNCEGDYFATGGADHHIMVWKTNFVK